MTSGPLDRQGNFYRIYLLCCSFLVLCLYTLWFKVSWGVNLNTLHHPNTFLWCLMMHLWEFGGFSHKSLDSYYLLQPLVGEWWNYFTVRPFAKWFERYDCLVISSVTMYVQNFCPRKGREYLSEIRVLQDFYAHFYPSSHSTMSYMVLVLE